MPHAPKLPKLQRHPQTAPYIKAPIAAAPRSIYGNVCLHTSRYPPSIAAMYWPVGTPRIYATSSNRASGSNLYVSYDGLPSPNAAPDAPPSPSRSPTKEEDEPPLATPITPATPAIEPVEHAEPAEHGGATSTSRTPEANSVPLKDPILALRVSRTGHMFAVITATSITLWQTKVSFLYPKVVFLC